MRPRPPDGTRLWFPLALVVFELIVYFSVDMYLPAMRELQNAYGTSERAIQFTVTGWLIGAGTTQLVLGPLSDHFGRRRVLLSGCVIFSMASLACALIPPLPWFVLLRTLQGSTICTAFVAGYACVHEIFSTEDAVRTLAWMNSVTVLAPAIGPLLGAGVLAFGTWRTISLLLGLAVLPTIALVHRWMPETVPEGGTSSLSFPAVFASYRNLLGNLPMMRHLATFCLVFSVMLSWNVTSPFLLVDPLVKDTRQFVQAQAYLYGLFIVGTRLANRWVGTRELSHLVSTGLGLCAVGAVSSLFATFANPHYLVSTLLFGLTTLGAGILFPPLFRLTVEHSKAPMGITMAVFSSGMNFFATTATLLVANLNVNSLLRYHVFAFILAASSLFVHFLPSGSKAKEPRT